MAKLQVTAASSRIALPRETKQQIAVLIDQHGGTMRQWVIESVDLMSTVTLHAHMQELAVALDLSTAHIVRRAVAELWQREVGLAKEEDHTWSSRLAAMESRLAAMERKDCEGS